MARLHVHVSVLLAAGRNTLRCVDRTLLGLRMSMHVLAASLPQVPFDGGYVQATKRGNSWRVTAWIERRLPSGTVYHTRVHTRVRRGQDAAIKAAAEMAAFWSRSNPDFQ
jgi:hypothetical protein